MTPEDENGRELERDELIAAEYVLGVLPAQERQEAARRILSDQAFARLVEAWEERLGPLAESYPSIEPPANAKSLIDKALFGNTKAVSAPAVAGFWNSLWLWRGLAAASLALALMVGALFLAQPPAEAPVSRLLATLTHDETDISLVAFYDEVAGQLILSRLSGQQPDDADFELWVIEGDRLPISLGVVDDEPDTRIDLISDLQALVQAGSLLAVSVEPPGGSPTGQPTGPVVAFGELRSI